MKNYCRLKPKPELLKKIRRPQQQRIRFLKLLGTYNKPTTIEHYRSALKKFQGIVKKPIQKITSDDILRFFKKAKQEGLKDITIVGYWECVKVYLRFYGRECCDFYLDE